MVSGDLNLTVEETVIYWHYDGICATPGGTATCH